VGTTRSGRTTADSATRVLQVDDTASNGAVEALAAGGGAESVRDAGVDAALAEVTAASTIGCSVEGDAGGAPGVSGISVAIGVGSVVTSAADSDSVTDSAFRATFRGRPLVLLVDVSTCASRLRAAMRALRRNSDMQQAPENGYHRGGKNRWPA